MTRLAGALLLSGILGSPGCGPARVVPPTDNTEVLAGATVLVDDGFALLDGMRVGLIANQTSRVRGEHLADLINDAANVELGALFGPEHGLRGEADDGLAVADGFDDRTGVPIYSLYGERRAPAPEVLAGLDALVFDIQDVGARFYTYISTMGLSMSAAAEAGIPFIVLDRPNPLGGEIVDGYVREPEFESFVGSFPIPIQHGLTVAELARMAVGEAWVEGADRVELVTVGLQGWERGMLWPDTGLEWIPTSPNIPDFASAVVYPGMCLFEATTLNEGRGTPTPFRLVGAPGLDAEGVLSGLPLIPGVGLAPATYRPVSIPGKSTNPRHRDVDVSGLHLTVESAHDVRPVRLGITILSAVVSHVGMEAVRASGLARLSGSERLYRSLEAGQAAEAIIASWAAEVQAFRSLRQPYLMYD